MAGLFSAGKESKGGLFGASKKPLKATAPKKPADIGKSNKTMLARIKASGEKSPLKPKEPSVLDRIFGVLDVPGTAVRSIVKGVVDPANKVDGFAEMGKALKGEKRVEGADILDALGVTDKWGKQLGGVALDVALDPVTYLTGGWSTLTKAESAVKLAKLSREGVDAAKLGEFSVDLAKLSAPVRDALAAGTKLAALDLSKADTRVIANAVRSTVGKTFGDKGGVKFAGISLGGSKALDKTAYAAKDVLRMAPGSEWFERAFTWGDATPLAREGNELLNAGIKSSLKKVAAERTLAGVKGANITAKIRKLVPDDKARMALTVGMSDIFGRYTEQGTLRAAHEAVQKAIESGEKAAIDAAEHVYISELKDVFNPNAILEAVSKVNSDPKVLEQAKAAADLISENYDRLLADMGAAGLPSTGLYHGAADVTGSASAGYAPGLDIIRPTKRSEKARASVLETLGVTNPLREQNNGGLLSQIRGMAKPQGAKSKADDNRTIMGRMVQGGLITELDAAALAGAKTTRDYSQIALQGFRDDIGRMLGVSADKIEETSPEMAQLFAATSKAFTNDEAFKGALGAYDKFLNLWKRWATIYNLPRFPARNALSNKVLQFFEGVFNPATESEGARIAALIAKGGVDTADKKTQDLVAELYSHGVITTQNQLAQQMGSKLERSANKAAAGYEALAGGINEFVENQSRIAAYLAAIAKGASPEAAGIMVDKALYNYSPEAMTAFERGVMKRLVPFYTWISQNAPHMAEVLVKSPGKMAAIFHAKESGEAVNPVDTEVMPDWLARLNPIPTPLTDVAGNTRMMATEGVLPIGDLEKILTPFVAPSEAPREALGMLSPLIKTPLELVFNKDLYYDSPISNYEGDSRRAPAYVERFDDIVHQLPVLKEASGQWDTFKSTFGIVEKTDKTSGEPYLAMNAYALKALKDLNPWLSAMGKMVDDQSKTPDDRFSYLTGVKTVNFDTPAFTKQKEYDDYTKLKGLMARLKAENKLAPPAKKAKKPKKSKVSELLGGK